MISAHSDHLQNWPEPRAAYIHVPFCAHRCGYCNFTVIAGRDDLIGSYLDALERELSSLGKPRGVDTLFFGGGTPTQLPLADLRRLLTVATHWIEPAAGCEISMEANPADVSESLLDLLLEFGVGRLSLGGQSFDARKLSLLERDHSPDQLRGAVELAQRRLPSVSLDLIFGVPGETLDVWRRDLAAALELEPQHVSTYGLTIERGTRFWSRLATREFAGADEELERQMFALAIDSLTCAGFEHYEVSNFAKAGHRCRHNETYWLGDPYYAFGPGASRYVDGIRSTNHRSTTTYIKRLLAGKSPVADQEQLGPEDRARERLVFGLRRLEGLDRKTFLQSTGFEMDSLVQRPLAKAIQRGLMSDDGKRVRLTREGLFVSDAIWPDFLVGSAR